MSAKLKTILILGAILLTALGMRALSHKGAFKHGRTYFFGSDSWNHMRRVHYAASHGFSMPEPEPLLNFPEGSYSQWGWLYDGIATLAVRAAGAAQKVSQERVAAWVPAILGALCVIPAFFLGAFLLPVRRAANNADQAVKAEAKKGKEPVKVQEVPQETGPNWIAGLLSAFFVAVLPGHAEYSLLGNIDHHVMESFLFVVSAACFVQLSRTSQKRLWTVLCGVAMALMYAQHPVLGNLYGGIFWVMCLTAWIFGKQDRDWHWPFLLAGLAMLPFAIHSLKLDPVGLEVAGNTPKALIFLRYSFFQPAALFFFGLTLLVLSGLRKNSLSVNLSAAAGALVCAIAVITPFILSSSILFGANRFYSQTAENMPILFYAQGQGFKPSFAHSMYGWLFLLFPVWWLREFFRRDRNFWLLSITGAVFFLVMFQVRFVYLFSYAFALALASTLLWLWQERSSWGFYGIAAPIVFALSFTPCVRWWNQLAQGSPYKYVSVTDGFYEACIWLKENAPKVEAFQDISKKPDWSVLAQWDSGHAIVYIAEKAVVADPFNHGMEPSARYYASVNPQEATKILNEKKVRYIFARDMSQAGWHGVYADFLNLDQSHPLRRGDWWRLFQMRLLLNYPVAGPDGHPFQWGHKVAFISSDGQEALFEYDASQVASFKNRSRSAPSGILAEMDGKTITKTDAELRARIDACAGTTDAYESFLGLMKMHALEAVMKKYKQEVSGTLLKQTAADLLVQTPGAVSCIEKIPGGKAAFERLVAKQILMETMAQGIAQASGITSEGVFFRLVEPKIRYRVYDRALESPLMIRHDPFLTALDQNN